MRHQRILCICIVLCMVLGAVGPAWAGMTRAQNTVNNIRQADPPRVSTTTKPSPVGQPISDYKPSGPSPTTSEPPSPTVNRNNPTNDPDVQRGYDDHQARYNN